MSVTPSTLTLDIGGTEQLQATVRNGRNETVSASVTWTSGDDSRASVSTGGLVTALAEGPVTITASAGGRNGTAAVTVTDPNPPGSPSGLQVTPLSDTEIRLDWTDNSTNEDEYRVEREVVGGPLAGSGPQAVYTTVATLGPNTTTYTDTGLDPAASYRYRVSACNENGCSEFSSEMEGTPFETLVIETTGLPDGAKDVAYARTLMASGGDGPPAWDLADGSLPTGLALNAAGEITGTPTVAGTFDFTVRATGAGQMPTRPLSITITEEIQAPEVETTQLPDGGVGASYAAQLQASRGDGSYVWSLVGGALPSGVGLGAGGEVSGVPTVDGAFMITVEVTSAELTGDGQVGLTIHPALSVATDELPDGLEGQAYGAQLMADGGDGATTWSLESGTLPAGLTLAANGMISGTPAAAGTSTFTVAVESGVGQMATRELSITIYAPLEVATSSLADGQFGAAYSETLAATGGDGDNSWSITAGALPDGLALNPATGEIAGTPDEVGTFDITVRVQSGDGQSATADLSIDVDPAPVEITTTSLPGGSLTVAYNQQLQASGGDGANYTWTLTGGGLPTGLDLSAGGAITGTPTANGTFDFTVEAASAGQTDEQELSITITEVIEAPEITTVSLPDGGVDAPYDAQLQAAQGDGNYAWAVTGGALPAGVVLAADGALSGTPTADGTFTVTFEVTSAAMTDEAEFDITIHPALSVTTDALPDGVEDQAYSVQLVADGGDGTTTWSLETGDLPPGLSLAADGTISGTPTAAGTSTFTVGVESGVGQMVTRELSITINEPLDITTSTLPNGQVGVAYSETLAATGGDGTNSWSLTGGSLPDGVSLNPTTGEISGTPTEAGSFNITVQAQSGDGQADAANLTLEIDPAPVEITTTSLPGGTVGVAYNQQLQASGGDGVNYTWSLAGGSLPTSLNLGADGVLSGTPTADGVFNFTVEVNSGGETDDQALSITIATGSVDPVVIETLFLPVAYVGTAYSGTVDASGGDGATFAFSVSAGTLPGGLSINGSTGAITGTPTTPGTGHFAIEVESGGNMATRVYMLTASGAPASAFNLHLHNISGVLPSASIQDALDQALAKWEAVITGNVSNLLINGLTDAFCGGFGDEFNGRTIDDIEILMDIAPIDGVGGTLASAGGCAIIGRPPSNQPLPVLGVTTFDSDDFGSFSTERARDIMFHEIGHVVGIGTLWDFGTNAFLTDRGGPDPRYTGASGVAQYTALGGPDPDIPVANTGGAGTRDAHWREVTFGNEIMTGFISAPGLANPISSMTIGSVADLGYSVNLAAAEAYTLPSPTPPGAPPPNERPAIDDIWPGPVAWVQPDGTVITIYLRPPEGGG